MNIVQFIVGTVILLERVWKHWLVVRFFRQPVPAARTTPTLVSIIQPVLSGDPTLQERLENNLRSKSHYTLEYIWIADTNDPPGQQICQELITRYPQQNIQLILLPPPTEGANPKTFKLIAGAKAARGDIICVLDDDTSLPDDGLAQCLPYLDQSGVGLAFGLPYYVNFSNMWSKLVAYFVNSHSLLTYIPYTTLTQPFTINGMFYAIKREVLDEVGGFESIAQILADDFAVARLIRSHGYRLAQTPLRHGISTQVNGSRPYLSLIQRWFVAPRESLMRHLNGRDLFVLYGLGLVPALVPLLLVISLLLQPSWKRLGYTLLYFGYSFAIFVHLNKKYLSNASPLRTAWWVPIIQITFPIQLLIALSSPQRINWRGNVIQVEKGGKFQYVSHRGGNS